VFFKEIESTLRAPHAVQGGVEKKDSEPQKVREVKHSSSAGKGRGMLGNQVG